MPPWELSDPPTSGRWQRGSIVPALYFADSEETALAEAVRFVHEYGAIPDEFLPRYLWTAEVDASNLVDLCDPETAKAYQVPSGLVPYVTDWPRFQPVGERIAAEGHKGLIAPSAAQISGATITIFPSGFREIEKTAQFLRMIETL